MTNRPTTAIFQTTGQALHVAFTVLSQPALSDGKFRQYLMQALEAQFALSPGNAAWLEQLRGTASSSVNFGGLSQIEIRGQCAMIVSSVNNRLQGRERGAVLARYGTWPEKLRGFDLMAAVDPAGLGDQINREGVIFALTVRHYLSESERKRFSLQGVHIDLSVRALAERFGESKSSLHRTSDFLRKTFDSLESRALNTLDPIFKSHGVVQVFDVAA